jgi:TPR repeat protein
MRSEQSNMRRTAVGVQRATALWRGQGCGSLAEIEAEPQGALREGEPSRERIAAAKSAAEARARKKADMAAAKVAAVVAQAQAGNSNAMYQLVGIFQRGDGVETNAATAQAWRVKAAEAGHPAAQYELGMQYLKGGGSVYGDSMVAQGEPGGK